MAKRAAIGKHLGTFNLFREADNSLWITCAEANGVRDELGDSGAPLNLCAMSALYAAADAMRARSGAPLAAVPGYVVVPEAVVAFLRGHGPLEGCYFGDPPPAGAKGNFWWRKYLLAASPFVEGGEIDQGAGAEIMALSQRILALAPAAGLYVGITIKDAPQDTSSGEME